MRLGLVVWALDKAVGQHQRRRRVALLVHEAVFLSRDPATGKIVGSEPHYFVKVTNLSETRDIEIIGVTPRHVRTCGTPWLLSGRGAAPSAALSVTSARRARCTRRRRIGGALAPQVQGGVPSAGCGRRRR